MSNPVDLQRLREDLDTATPHQIPTWRDGLTEAEVDAIEARINHNLQQTNTIRRAMRHHPDNDIRV